MLSLVHYQPVILTTQLQPQPPTWAMISKFYCNHCSFMMSFLRLILHYDHIPHLYILRDNVNVQFLYLTVSMVLPKMSIGKLTIICSCTQWWPFWPIKLLSTFSTVILSKDLQYNHLLYQCGFLPVRSTTDGVMSASFEGQLYILLATCIYSLLISLLIIYSVEKFIWWSLCCSAKDMRFLGEYSTKQLVLHTVHPLYWGHRSVCEYHCLFPRMQT